MDTDVDLGIETFFVLARAPTRRLAEEEIERYDLYGKPVGRIRTVVKLELLSDEILACVLFDEKTTDPRVVLTYIDRCVPDNSIAAEDPGVDDPDGVSPYCLYHDMDSKYDSNGMTFAKKSERKCPSNRTNLRSARVPRMIWPARADIIPY